MAEIRLLPDNVALQYSELMQQCIQPAPDGANLSFKSKTIGGKRYWYLYISLGNRRTEHYLGAESSELLDTIEDEKALWESIHELTSKPVGSAFLFMPASSLEGVRLAICQQGRDQSRHAGLAGNQHVGKAQFAGMCCITLAQHHQG